MSGEYYDTSVKSLQEKYPCELKREVKSAIEGWYYSEMGSKSDEDKCGSDWRKKMKPVGPYFTKGTNTPDKTQDK